MTTLSKASFARHLGVSRARVTQYCRAGMPVAWDGTVDIERAERWIRTRVRTNRNGWQDRGRWQVEFRHCREEEARLQAEYGKIGCDTAWKAEASR